MGGGAGKYKPSPERSTECPSGRSRVHALPEEEEKDDADVTDGMPHGKDHDMSGTGSMGATASERKRRTVSVRMMGFLRNEKELREFRPRVDFLRVIASPQTELDTYCHTIISEVTRVSQASACSVYFVDDFRKEVWSVGAKDRKPTRFKWNRGIVGLTARETKTQNVAVAHEHPAFDKGIEDILGFEVKSMVTVPVHHMVDQTRTIGVIQALNKQGGHAFDHLDESELEKFSMLIGDSFNRQHWRALEAAALEENEACALLSTVQVWTSERCSAAPTVDSAVAPTTTFSWKEAEDSHQNHLRHFACPSSCQPATEWRSLSFDVLQYSAEDLVRMVPIMFTDAGVLTSARVVPDRLMSWSWAVYRSYKANPFHNWFHAAAVFQNVYSQLIRIDFGSGCFRFLDAFSVLIAALSHDMDHPGVTNSFLVDGSDELALRYNDNSVLENHHSFLACALLRREETAAGSHLPAEDQVELRRSIIRCILDTDMTRHSEMCQQAVAKLADQGSSFSVTTRQFWLSMLLHTADLSAQTQEWTVAKAWEQRISKEFAHQAKLESQAGRQPAPFMQFHMDDAKHRGKLQRNFIDFVLIPLWDPYSQLLPATRPCFERLLANRGRYVHLSVHGSEPPDGVAQNDTL